MAGKIEAPGCIELHIICALPPGIDPVLMEANLMASTAIAVNITPYVRGFFTQLHPEGPEEVKQKYSEVMEGGKGKPRLV